jgi:hypothetical protein
MIIKSAGLMDKNLTWQILSGNTGAEDVGTSEPEAMFRHVGNTVHVRLSHTGLHFSPAATNCFPIQRLPDTSRFTFCVPALVFSSRC